LPIPHPYSSRLNTSGRKNDNEIWRWREQFKRTAGSCPAVQTAKSVTAPAWQGQTLVTWHCLFSEPNAFACIYLLFHQTPRSLKKSPPCSSPFHHTAVTLQGCGLFQVLLWKAGWDVSVMTMFFFLRNWCSGVKVSFM